MPKTSPSAAVCLVHVATASRDMHATQVHIHRSTPHEGHALSIQHNLSLVEWLVQSSQDARLKVDHKTNLSSRVTKLTLLL